MPGVMRHVITPDTLVQMMKGLRIRKTTAEAESYVNKLDTLPPNRYIATRSLKLGKRMNISVDIGTLKKEHNVAVLQSKRWNEIQEDDFGRRRTWVGEEFVLRIFKAITESINHRKR